MRRNTKAVSVCAAAAVAALFASRLSAVEIQWKGGAFNVQGGIVSSTQLIIVGPDDPLDAFSNPVGVIPVGTANVTGGSFRASNNDIRLGVGNRGVINVSAGGQVFAISTSSSQAA